MKKKTRSFQLFLFDFFFFLHKISSEFIRSNIAAAGVVFLATSVLI